MKGKIRRVAVVGAGPSGATATDALVKEQTFAAVRVFDRRAVPGGTWIYTPHLPAAIPSLRKLLEGTADAPVPIPAQLPAQTEKSEAVNSHQIRFSDTAQHEHLHTNITPEIMSFTTEPFSETFTDRIREKYGENAPFRGREHVRQGVQDTFVKNGHESLLELSTTVGLAEKKGDEWVLTLRKELPGKDSRWQENFDVSSLRLVTTTCPGSPTSRALQIYYHTWDIDDPTLAFLGMCGGGFTFRLFEWQAVAVARLLAGRGNPLPSKVEQKEWETKRVAEFGGGKAYYTIAPDYKEVFEDFRSFAGDPASDTAGRVLPPFDDNLLEIWTTMGTAKIKFCQNARRKAEEPQATQTIRPRL